MIRIENIETATALRRAFVRVWRDVRPMTPASEPDSRFARGMCIVTSQTIRLLDPSWSPVYGTVVVRPVVAGHPSRFPTDEPHTWVERDGIALDLTGDQFAGHPPVLYGPRPDSYSGTCACGEPDGNTCADEIMFDDEHREAHDWRDRVLRYLLERDGFPTGGDVRGEYRDPAATVPYNDPAAVRTLDDPRRIIGEMYPVTRLS